MGLRRKSRELALQFLFGHDFQGHSCASDVVLNDLSSFIQSFDFEQKSLEYAQNLITGLCEKREEIDRCIAENSHNWRLERMSLVDRNILRIAIFEMKCSKDVPAQVAINEALEIAKRYSVQDSVAFINGILDSIETRRAIKEG